MKMSKVYSISLGLVTALSCSVGQVFAATVPIPPIQNTGATGVPAECGSGVAQFLPTSGFPLSAKLGVGTSAEVNFAGIIVLAPNQNADPTNVQTLAPIPYQGNFTQLLTFNTPANQGSFAVQTYVAYSYVNKNGVTKYGVSQVPTTLVNVTTNHSLKGKSASAYVVADTDLTAQKTSLGNLIGNNTPGNQATNLTLLGIGQGIFGSADGGAVSVAFSSPTLNQTTLPGTSTAVPYPVPSGQASNVPVGAYTAQGANLNCATFITTPVVPAGN